MFEVPPEGVGPDLGEVGRSSYTSHVGKCPAKTLRPVGLAERETTGKKGKKLTENNHRSEVGRVKSTWEGD